MKKYDRETKQWLDEETIEKKQAKRKLCKGGREHRYILTLPSFIVAKGSVLGIDIAEKYYQIEEKRNKLNAEIDEELEDIGIVANRSRTLRGIKTYICTVCKKRKY